MYINLKYNTVCKKYLANEGSLLPQITTAVKYMVQVRFEGSLDKLKN